MNPLLAAALFFIIWWLCFFVMLPVGVRSLEEAGVSDAEGHDTGAPATPDLGRKALWTTGLALVVWGVALVVLFIVYYSR